MLENNKNPACIKTTASSCGKAIIIGEHAVLYGARAIAAPLINYKTYINAAFYPNINIKPRLLFKNLDSNLDDLIKQAANLLNIKNNILMSCKTNIPISAGLGASASLCVSLLRALDKLFNLKLSSYQIADYATTLEHKFHGKSSGLDPSVISHEKITIFTTKSPLQFLNLSLKTFNFILIDTNKRSSTLKMVEQTRPFFINQKGDLLIEKFDNLANNIYYGLKSSDIYTVSDAINESSILLDQIGVASKEAKQIMDVSKNLGALAAKPTGAGGGGFVLILLDPKNPDLLRKKIIKELNNPLTLTFFHQ